MNSLTLPEFSASIPPRSSTPNNASSIALSQSASNSNHSYSIDKAFTANARKASYGQPPIRNLLLDIPPPDPLVEQVIRGEVPRNKSKSKKRRKKSSPVPVNNLLNADKIQEIENQLQASKAALKAAEYKESEHQSSLQQLIQQRDTRIAEISKSITDISSDDGGIVDSEREKSQREKENEFLKKQQVLREKIKVLTNEFEEKYEGYRKKEEELEENRKRRLEKEEEQTQMRKRKLESIDQELVSFDSAYAEQQNKNDSVANDQEKEEGEETEESLQLKDGMAKTGELLQSQRKTVELEVSLY